MIRALACLVLVLAIQLQLRTNPFADQWWLGQFNTFSCFFMMAPADPTVYATPDCRAYLAKYN